MAKPRTTSIENDLYFTYESGGSIMLFTLFINVKAITKLKLHGTTGINLKN